MVEQLNDVNVLKIKELDQAVRQNPASSKATMKVSSSWHRGTKTIVEVGSFEVGGQSFFPPTRKFLLMIEEPELMGGVDSAPTPIETAVAALAGCLSNGIATNAALFDVPLDRIDIEIEADIDFKGFLGHDKSVRSGISDIRYTVTIQSPAPEDKVRRCKETLDRKSAVRDTLANPVNITSKFVYKPS